MSKILSIISIITCISVSSSAQDFHFSQFYENATLRNPALTSVIGSDYRIAAQYKTQWSSISQPFVTSQISFEGKIHINQTSSDFFGYGFTVNQDKAGTVNIQSIGVYPTLSFNKSLEDQYNSFLSIGFTGGYVQRNFDPNKVTVNNQYQGGSFDPYAATGENFGANKISYFDLGAGVSFSSGGGEYNQITYFLGASGFHLTQPQTSFLNNENSKLAAKYVASAGMNYRINEVYGLMLQGNYTTQGKYNETLLGGLASLKVPSETENNPLFILYLGSYYRLGDALIPVIKADYMRYSIGVSYDVNVSSLKVASAMRGGLEISIVKTGMYRESDNGRTLCPHFFY